MGMHAEWLAVRVSNEEQEREARTLVAALGEAELTAPTTHAGWLWTGMPGAYGVLDEAAPGISAGVGQPALGGWVGDSDFGCVDGTGGSGAVAFEFIVNELPEDEDQRLRDLWLVPERRREAAEALALWSSSFAPAPVTADVILAGMPGHGSIKPP